MYYWDFWMGNLNNRSACEQTVCRPRLSTERDEFTLPFFIPFCLLSSSFIFLYGNKISEVSPFLSVSPLDSIGAAFLCCAFFCLFAGQLCAQPSMCSVGIEKMEPNKP